MSVVNRNTISVEHTSHLLDDICPASLNSVSLLHCVGVVRLRANQVKHIWVAFKGTVIDTLDQEIWFFSFLSHKYDTFNVFLVANQDRFESCLSLVQNQELLVLKRELESD